MNEPRNPYAPPTTHVADQEAAPAQTDSGLFIPDGRSRPASRGAAWIGDAWRMLRARPGRWVVSLLILFVGYIAVSVIPFMNVFVQLLVPFGYAGVALAADQQRRTGSFEVSTILAGFSKQPASLLAVGGTVILAYIVVVLVMLLLVGMQLFGAIARGARAADPSIFHTEGFVVAIVISLALLIPVGLATYLAPQIIVLHDQPALAAMKMSFSGCVRNILPGIVFSLCLLALLVVAMIPLFLGLPVFLPVLAITSYTVYRDIFIEENSQGKP